MHSAAFSGFAGEVEAQRRRYRFLIFTLHDPWAGSADNSVCGAPPISSVIAASYPHIVRIWHTGGYWRARKPGGRVVIAQSCVIKLLDELVAHNIAKSPFYFISSAARYVSPALASKFSTASVPSKPLFFTGEGTVRALKFFSWINLASRWRNHASCLPLSSFAGMVSQLLPGFRRLFRI